MNISKRFKILYLLLVFIFIILCFTFYFLKNLPVLTIAEKDKFPYTEEENLFLDSLKNSIENCNFLERQEIIYHPIRFFDKKSDYIITMEIRKNKRDVNYSLLYKLSKEIMSKAYELNRDEDKINSYIVQYNFVNPSLPVMDSIKKGNRSIIYYPKNIDTVVVLKFGTAQLLKR